MKVVEASQIESCLLSLPGEKGFVLYPSFHKP